MSKNFCREPGFEGVLLGDKPSGDTMAIVAYFVSLKMSSAFARTRTATGIAS